MYPQPGSHVLSLPFKFTLPRKLPPSCSFDVYRKKGFVSYFIEVVGKRSTFRLNKRIVCPFAVMSPDAAGAQTRDLLAAGWQGGWKLMQSKKDIRKGILGDFSTVAVEVRPIQAAESSS